MDPSKESVQQSLKVAGVVSFYMGAALVVSPIHVPGSVECVCSPTFAFRWSLCEGFPCFEYSRVLILRCSNKVVLNSSPDLPILFLFIQLLLAVVLLHASALVIPKVEIPKLELRTAKKVTPVTLVNVIGLVFNILCLRGVEASFFQVSSSFAHVLNLLELCQYRLPEVLYFHSLLWSRRR